MNTIMVRCWAHLACSTHQYHRVCFRRAKEKRERLRRAQGATDYIALHDNNAGDDIVRREKDGESDESGDDLDADKRLKFIGGPPEKQYVTAFPPSQCLSPALMLADVLCESVLNRSGAGVFSHAAPMGDDELDEEDGWVAEQIRKVGWGKGRGYAYSRDIPLPQCSCLACSFCVRQH
jgi:hypothetical protein